MSVNRTMKIYRLQELQQTRTESGNKRAAWKDAGEILVSIHKVSEQSIPGNVRYGDATHTGLTYCRALRKSAHRLARDGITYEILSVNPESRLTNLILKVVDEDV